MCDAAMNSSLALLKRGQGLESAVTAASEILGNPVFMFDMAYNILATTENRVTDDPLWNEVHEEGRFSYETVDFFKRERFIEAYAVSETVALMHSDKLKYERANGKVFDADGIQVANILVLACYKPFEEGDFELIERICEFVSVELQNSEAAQKIGRVFEENLVGRMIEGRIQDGASEDELKELYAGLRPHLFVVVVDVVRYDRTLTHLEYFRSLFQRMQGEYKYFIYVNNIVIIAGVDRPNLSVSRDLRGLRDYFIEHAMYAGISSSFQNLLDLRQYYLEALVALNYGTEFTHDEHFFKYDDYRLNHFLNSIKHTADLKEACNPIVPLIQNYDREHGTSYFTILYTYLGHGMKPLPAAEKLGMEREELERCLETMGELFEINWNNGDVLKSVYASIQILEGFDK